MSAVSSLISDLEEAIARAPDPARRADTLRRVTDLFLRDADALTDDQLDLFDVVIARLAAAIESRARAELAERLADVAQAPRGIIRSLAHDQIGVARPVLTRSGALSDEDLVAVALAKGRDHMLAISARATLTEPVTDVLVSRGDRLVAHAVAGNPGARLSGASASALVDRSRADEPLRALLTRRDDLAEAQVRQLITIAKETARRRLAEAMPDASAAAIEGALERGATEVEAAVVPGRRDYGAAHARVRALAAARPLFEADLAAAAARDDFEEAVCLLAALVGVALPAAEHFVSGSEADLVLVVAKAQGWSWPTAQALLRLRAPGASPHDLRRAQATYEGLAPATAQRVVRFIKAREATQRQAAEAAVRRRQIRGQR